MKQACQRSLDRLNAAFTEEKEAERLHAIHVRDFLKTRRRTRWQPPPELELGEFMAEFERLYCGKGQGQ